MVGSYVEAEKFCTGVPDTHPSGPRRRGSVTCVESADGDTPEPRVADGDTGAVGDDPAPSGPDAADPADLVDVDGSTPGVGDERPVWLGSAGEVPQAPNNWPWLIAAVVALVVIVVLGVGLLRSELRSRSDRVAASPRTPTSLGDGPGDSAPVRVELTDSIPDHRVISPEPDEPESRPGDGPSTSATDDPAEGEIGLVVGVDIDAGVYRLIASADDDEPVTVKVAGSRYFFAPMAADRRWGVPDSVQVVVERGDVLTLAGPEGATVTISPREMVDTPTAGPVELGVGMFIVGSDIAPGAHLVAVAPGASREGPPVELAIWSDGDDVRGEWLWIDTADTGMRMVLRRDEMLVVQGTSRILDRLPLRFTPD